MRAGEIRVACVGMCVVNVTNDRLRRPAAAAAAAATQGRRRPPMPKVWAR